MEVQITVTLMFVGIIVGLALGILYRQRQLTKMSSELENALTNVEFWQSTSQNWKLVSEVHKRLLTELKDGQPKLRVRLVDELTRETHKTEEFDDMQTAFMYIKENWGYEKHVTVMYKNRPAVTLVWVR